MLVKGKFQGQDSYFLIHLEHQACTEPEFGRRMFRYFARLYERHALPVYPIVLFSHQMPLQALPATFRVEFPNKRILEFNYDVIQLNQLQWRDFVNQDNPVAVALMAKMQIQPQERARVKLECLRLLTTLKLDPARSQLISGFVDTYLRLTAEEEGVFRHELDKIEPEAKESVMEIVTSWMEEGLQQGLRQGRQEEAYRLIMRLLKRRFGVLPSEIQAQMQLLTLERLEVLGEELLDFQSLADLAAWLE